METTMTKAMAMSTGSEICTRPWRGANTAHAGTFRSVQGRTVPVRRSVSTVATSCVADPRRTGIDAAAPFTGVVYPRLEAPPV